ANGLFPLTAVNAQAAITAWIGYNDSESLSSDITSAVSWAKQFPLDVTKWITEARNTFLQKLTSTLSGVPPKKQDQAALSWWQLQTSKSQRSEIRLVALKALIQHLKLPAFSQAATELLVSELEKSPAADHATVTTLRQLVPPPVPSAIPTEPADALKWVTEE